jgi:hypothetical protein
MQKSIRTYKRHSAQGLKIVVKTEAQKTNR